MNKQLTSSLFQAVSIALLISWLAGCGAGSGAAVETSQPSSSAASTGAIIYSGPAPASADVVSFKTNVWDNLVPDNRCGGCHDTQVPRFIRIDDINLAYQAANTVANLDSPAESRLVTKVASGHHCWLSSTDACRDVMIRYIAGWAGQSGDGETKTITLSAPVDRQAGSSKSLPESSNLFATTVHPLVTQYCATCHADDASMAQSPFFASSDPDTAYLAAQTLIDLNDPSASRLVVRLRSEFHNCWTDCGTNADTMQNAITTIADAVVANEVDPDLVISKALRLTDGIVAASGGRFESNLIAFWEFKTGSGTTAFDTSGVNPAINLSFAGDVSWAGGWGIRLNGGRAQGTTTASSKLAQLITGTSEFTVEAWVTPGNVTQEGPATITTYSGSATQRNFLIGQTLYNYDALVRSENTNGNGEPGLSTPDADEVLQATQQHVVLTYDTENGRQLFVNGELIEVMDDSFGSLADWDSSFALVLGSEVGGANPWQGIIRMLAIYNRALTAEQVIQNYDVGVGERYFLLFDVSTHTGIEDAYILFEAGQFDSYAYLFEAPRFVTLSGSYDGPAIDLQGMRIGLNGREVETGQAYARLATQIDGNQFGELGQSLSNIGTVIELERGPEDDEFFLTFDRLGSSTFVRVEGTIAPLSALTLDEESSTIALRQFDEINATLSALTGVSDKNTAVRDTFLTIREQLPTVETIGGFLSSHQMGVTQLAIAYCDALVEDNSARATFFPGLAFNAAPEVALAPASRGLLIDPLLNQLAITGSLLTQPDIADVRSELNNLVDGLSACAPGCPSDRTETIAKSTCAASFASAAMMIQ